MIQIKVYFFTFLLMCVFGLSQSTVDLQCVPLRDCPKLLNLVKQPISENTVKILQTAQCGFDNKNEPLVWCAQELFTSNCVTPDGETGKCTPIRDCESFVQFLDRKNGLSMDIVTYLQKFQCRDQNIDSSTVTICCPINLKVVTAKEPIISTQEPSLTPLPLIIDPPDVTIQNRPSFLPRPTKGECGLQVVNKITGGKVTEMDEFPWTALLEYHLGTRVRTACAGTLISEKYVVTAAHCTDREALRSVGKLTHVILGEFDIRTPRDCTNSLGFQDCADPPVKVSVESIIVHPQWYTRPPAQINHDIALLRLAESVEFTDFIKPICLPSSTLILKEKEKLVVTGWGQTEHGVPSYVKLKTTIPMANREFCIQKYKDDKKLVVGDGEICVGGEGGRDSCLGDSGGPLMFTVDRSGNGVWFLVGIVSFGSNQPCGIEDYPALYTYLPKYINWIYQTVEP